ncbi:MAG TPA: hypothetical protein DCZ59_04900 [Bacteroidetes bacterium]|nr:hypothetical protein [Bacteroidota bacterium]
MSKSTKIFVAILLTCSVGLAVAYVVYRYSYAVSFYEVTDMIREQRRGEQTSVYFIRVADYDSLSVRGVAEDVTRKTLDSNVLDQTATRRFLYHVYATSDTSELTQDMLDELAYTNPGIEDPATKLRVVRNGWMIQYMFAANRLQPREFSMKRTYFFIPKTGINARDIQ